MMNMAIKADYDDKNFKQIRLKLFQYLLPLSSDK